MLACPFSVVELTQVVSYYARKYDAFGPDKVEPLFHGDSTHTSMEGAKINADSVVEGLKALPNDPLAPYLLALVAGR